MLDFIKEQKSAIKSDTSVWFLVAANLVPLVGVLFWDWSVFEVVVLYWLENVIIGVINILKMATCSPDSKNFDFQAVLQESKRLNPNMTDAERDELDQAEAMMRKNDGKVGPLNQGLKLFLIPFFTVHYGMFCFVHGMFVFVLLGENGPLGSQMIGGPGAFPELIRAAMVGGGAWAALALLLSHLFSFVTNYIGKKEYQRTTLSMLMAAPYGRIVVLHVAILFGAFAITALGSPLFLIVLLIGGKIALDLKMHFRSHQKASSHVKARA